MYKSKSDFFGTLTKRLSSNAGTIETNDGCIGLQYESTVVAQYCDSGIKLNSSGHNTMTTKKWMNYFINDYRYNIYQKKGQWYVSYKYSDKVVEFYDNIILSLDTFA